MLLSPEQEPDNVKVIYVAAAPIVGQHRHERKQQPHHAVLHSKSLLCSSCLSRRHSGIKILVTQAVWGGSANGGEAHAAGGLTCRMRVPMVIWPCGEAVTLLSVRHFTTIDVEDMDTWRHIPAELISLLSH